MTGYTPTFGLPYLEVGQPARDTRRVLEESARTIEAALTAGGVVPPSTVQYAQLVAQLAATSANARRSGAKGDGVTNDTAALQAALDQRGVVVIPPGVYAISGALRVHANTTIVAYGATIRQATSGGLLYNFGGTTAVPGYTGAGAVTVLGGTWDCNAAGNGGGAVTGGFNGFYLAHASGVTLRDVTITNVANGHAIDLTGCERVLIDGCRFLGYIDNTPDKSRQFSEAIQIDVASALSNLPVNDNTPCRDVTITGCLVGPSSRLGSFGRFVGSHGMELHKVAVNHTGIRVAGNRVRGTLREGIRAEAWSFSVIEGNVLSDVGSTGTYTGIQVTTVDPTVAGNVPSPIHSVTVRGNLLQSPSGGGISVGAVTDARIEGNTVRGSGGIGIYVGGVAGTVIAGNTVDGCVSHGIGAAAQWGANCSDLVIQGNLVRAPASNGTAAGIRLSAGGYALVTGNKVRRATGAAANGVSVDAAAGSPVIGNDLSGNGWAAATALANAAGTATKTDWAGGTAVPGHNLI